MTAEQKEPGYHLETLPFRGSLPLDMAPEAQQKLTNWPTVYVLDNKKQVYVGETTNTLNRRLQHQADPRKSALTTMRVVLHEEFNKSAALDLESYLIRLLGGDTGRQSLNGNLGLQEHDYYDRARYREMFEEIFEHLREQRVFSQSRDRIINSTLFKLSPFKSLTADQERSLAAIVDGIVRSEDPDAVGPFVVQGGPGTGKTVLGVFLMKLLADLALLTEDPAETDLSTDEAFHPIFTHENHERLLRHRADPQAQGLTIGIVVPQQSLRQSLKAVFKHTPGLHPTMVVDPWDVGEKKFANKYDVLIVDEAHRLNLRASQSSGMQNAKFPKINADLFGADDPRYTQLDWISDRSVHQILLLDPRQTVRPADLDQETVDELLRQAHTESRFHALTSQLRVEASDDYVAFFGQLLRGEDPTAPQLGQYDLRLYSDFRQMREDLQEKEAQFGLARLAAGYAWEWKSRATPKKKPTQDWDIEIQGVRLPWNRTDKEWVTSPGSVDEVGSIHTLQGYDLNYAGVIIGEDLTWDSDAQRVVFRRENYYDKRGKRDNRMLERSYSDEDLREYVINIYNVLLTRGVRGTYLYVVDEGLRRQFERWFPQSGEPDAGWESFGIAAGRRPGELGSPVDIAFPAQPVVRHATQSGRPSSPVPPTRLSPPRGSRLLAASDDS